MKVFPYYKHQDQMDCSPSFNPELIRKRETILAESLESKIIGMYGLRMSLRDISKHIKDMCGTEIGHSTINVKFGQFFSN